MQTRNRKHGREHGAGFEVTNKIFRSVLEVARYKEI
jgi:hypothetical protein